MSVRMSINNDSVWQMLFVNSWMILGLLERRKFSVNSSTATTLLSSAPIAAIVGSSGRTFTALPVVLRLDKHRLFNWFGKGIWSSLRSAALPSWPSSLRE